MKTKVAKLAFPICLALVTFALIATLLGLASWGTNRVLDLIQRFK